MRKKLFLVSAFAAGCLLVSAQSAKLKYTAHATVGMIGGENGPALQLQAVNGVAYKTWAAGVGVGLDHYFVRTIPVFLDLRKTFSEKPKSGFAYLSGGYTVPWLSEKNRAQEVNAFVSDAKQGVYGEGGVGFATPVFKNLRFLLSAGWQVRKFTHTVNTMPWISIWPAPKDAYRDYDYTLTGFTMKAGLRF